MNDQPKIFESSDVSFCITNIGGVNKKLFSVNGSQNQGFDPLIYNAADNINQRR